MSSLLFSANGIDVIQGILWREAHAVVVGFGASSLNADVGKFARGLLHSASLTLKIPTDLVLVEAIVEFVPDLCQELHDVLKVFYGLLDALPDGAEEDAALPYPFLLPLFLPFPPFEF